MTERFLKKGYVIALGGFKLGSRVSVHVHDPEHFTDTLVASLAVAVGTVTMIHTHYDHGGPVDRPILVHLDTPAKCCEAENWPPMESVWLTPADLATE